MREAAGVSAKVASGAQANAQVAAADSERILLLELRLERLSSALDEARADTDLLRTNLAHAAAREADHTRRYSLVHQELAEARAEIASLHQRLNRSEALRSEIEGNLFEAGTRGDAGELVRLRRELLTLRQRSMLSEQNATRLRARVDDLLLSRETLLTRVAEWQRLVRTDAGAVDLSEFIAELRREIMLLEHRNVASERQEAALRERLARAGVDLETPLDANVATPASLAAGPVAPASLGAEPAAPDQVAGADAAEEADDDEDGHPVDGDAVTWASFADSIYAVPGVALPAPVVHRDEAEASTSGQEVMSDSPLPEPVNDAEVSEPASDAVLREPNVEPMDTAPFEELRSSDPSVRAAAYERLVRTLNGTPSQLAHHLRPGLADSDPRVRRRAVLAASTARSLALRPLLEPMMDDSDPNVRRIVREVLRHAPDEKTGGDDPRQRTVVALPEARYENAP